MAVRNIPPPSPPPRDLRRATPPRRPLRDNPRGILAGMLLLLAALAGIVALANRSQRLSPDFLAEFVLYALWAADVTMLLGMTFILAVLVLIVGSELIRNSVDRWFNTDVQEVLTSAESIASDYYHDRQVRVTDDAARIARALGALNIDGSDVAAVRDLILPEVAQGRVKMVEVYRIVPGGAVSVVPYVDVAAPAPDLPQGYARAV